MIKISIGLALLSAIITTSLLYGFIVHKHQMFPYDAVKFLYQNLKYQLQKNNNGPWSIGIYEGVTPFDLSDPKDIINPVLTAKDVTDVNAKFVADPFITLKDNKYFMFFEILNRATDQGDIGYAESSDGKKWEYRNIVIDEDFHLSYPHIFEWENNYYLIPESHEDLSVRLYKAESFPDKWEHIGNILNGYHYIDPSIFRHNDKWWLFVSDLNNDVLNLYYSSDLLDGWKSHPMNPIVKLNKNIARPGGRVVSYNNRLYRMTQDDEPRYGIQVFGFEITELTEESYQEQIISEEPIVTQSGKGWNATGMHHVDVQYMGTKWIAAVDGSH